MEADDSKPFRTSFGDYNPSMEIPLTREYFRQEVVQLSQDLIGKVIVRETPEGTLRGVIVETEAYKAPLDKAAHAYNNKKTPRTKYFWLDGGHLYLYTIYMPTNVCLNVVAGHEGEPEAVLIRAIEPIQGLPQMIKVRNLKSNKLEDLSNGPAKLGQCLEVKMELNGSDLTQGELRIVDGGIKGFKIATSARINIDYAEEWVLKEWRFFMEANKFVSKAPSKKSKEVSVDKTQGKLKVVTSTLQGSLATIAKDIAVQVEEILPALVKVAETNPTLKKQKKETKTRGI